MMTLSWTWQLCPRWVKAMSMTRLPTVVSLPSSTPLWMVTYSRMTHSSPTRVAEGCPW